MHVRRFMAIVGVAVLTACSGTARPQKTPALTPSPVAPTRSAITAAVDTFFSHMTLASFKSLHRPTSTRHFVNDKESWSNFTDYLNSDQIVPHIDDVRGPTADVSATYRLVADDKAQLLFMRRDTLTFVHGRDGWLVDSLHTSDKAVTALIIPDGTRQTITDSHFDPATGKVTFTDEGYTVAWTPNRKTGGWGIDVLSTPAPAPVAQAPGGPSRGSLVPQNDIPQQSQPAPQVQQQQESVQQTGPAGGGDAAEADCEDVGVQDVYADGEILELDDGRKLRVADADQSISDVWVAPFDGLICDGGDKFINKDDNESVELSP